MRSAAPPSPTLRRASPGRTGRADHRPLRARALLAALLGAITPASAARRLSNELSLMTGSLAEHATVGDEQSLGDMMAALDAVRRAIDDAAPGERRMLARAIRNAGQI